MKVIVTGGCGFIGSNLIRYLLEETPHQVLNVDKLTYAGNLKSLADLTASDRYRFVQADIRDAQKLRLLFQDYLPDAVLHLAAESHVDRSIDGPAEFVQTNIVGTYCLLEESLNYTRTCRRSDGQEFRFLHVSTDEVFGSLGETGRFVESTPYRPRSPYAASKASSDHLVRAWGATYGLPIIVTNCSNNYGPYQFPEKLIPLMVIKCLRGESLPVYGEGLNVRDWLYVGDHAKALCRVLEAGEVFETYNIGGGSERTNIAIVHSICDIMDQFQPRTNGQSHRDLIRHVEDRPGHDFRYAIESQKIQSALGWKPEHSLDDSLRTTVRWYLDHRDWWTRILDGSYQLERLGGNFQT